MPSESSDPRFSQDPPFESEGAGIWWASGIESFIRHLLDTDPHTKEALAEIEGRVVDIVIKDHEEEKTGGIRLLFKAKDVLVCGYLSNDGSIRETNEAVRSGDRKAKEDGIASPSGGIGGRAPPFERTRGREARPPAAADLVIIGTPFSLLRFAASGDRQEMVLNADVVLHGDTALAARLQAILSKMDIDFEELVARRIGDIPARMLVQGVCDIAGRLREAGGALCADLSEYLRYESDLVAKQDEGERFVRSVDDLRDDIARLEARIALLEESSGKKGQ
ncbi:ubiquinone biosynthesis accessory factor UbiJ [Thioalkalivibrio sp. HK1]|uniref:ubiquinone biosynthesis accessory factor UbiJ n=1 Tax=Thioalkalivibrio sp. HK1 TaxID=1469245 RepID=UPI000471B2EA|nr:hypothetical protein [Thioalkalivibrio sp. HK1]